MTDIKILDEKPFHILLIEPGKINQLDWNNPDYIQTLVNMPFVKTILVEPSKFFEKIYELLKINPKQKIVLTDLRFPDEIKLIKELNGIIIRVKRNIDKSDNEFVVVHESETYIDIFEVDYDFDNNDTMDKLYKQFDDLFLFETQIQDT